jgi:hypothetical protein
MSDNIQVTAGSGTTIAADDISGVLHQRVKLTWGVDGSATDASATNPLPVTPYASENHLGEVGGRTIIISASITRPADTTAYASGDAVADSTSSPSVLTFSRAARINQGSCVIIGAVLVDSANQTTKGDFDLFIFDTTYTANNDNASFAPTDAEMETCLGTIRFSSGNFIVGNAASGASGNALCPGTMTDNIGFKCGSGSTSLFGRLVARSAYTPVYAEKFMIRLRILQD